MIKCFSILLLLATSTAAAADDATTICGTGWEFHIAAVKKAYLTCNGGLRGMIAKAELFDLTERDADPLVAAKRIDGEVSIQQLINRTKNKGLLYESVDFPRELEPDHSYILRISPVDHLEVFDGNNKPVAPGTQGWAPMLISFNTKASAILTNSVDVLDVGVKFQLNSTMAIRSCKEGQSPSIQESISGESKKDHNATLQRFSTNAPGEQDIAIQRCAVPVKDPETQLPVFDPALIGMAMLTMDKDQFQQGKAVLNVKGVFDVFGRELGVPKNKQKITLKDVPKGKDDSSYYLKFSHQAGQDSKPSWSVDTKFAPVLPGVVGGFSPTLNVLADIGYGTTASTNTLKLGGGLTRLFRFERTDLQGIRFSPVLSVEADRDFKTKKNIVAEPDFRFYFPFMNHSRDLRSRRAFVDAYHKAFATGGPEAAAKIDPDSKDYAKLVGFFMQFWTGIETGSTMATTTFQTKDKKSSVVVPSYGIVRPRPRLQATLELWRFSFDFTATPRYIANTEWVGRVRSVTDATTGKSSDQAYLYGVQGWRLYGELSMQFAIDRSKHISISTTYKRGSAPPTFDKVNTIQSGLSIKY